jgi:hypothetical protein
LEAKKLPQEEALKILAGSKAAGTLAGVPLRASDQVSKGEK